MNTNTQFSTSRLVILGLMAAVLLLMAFTPLGYLKIGVLEITFNMIPVAISAIVLGPFGGAVTGAIFGLTSFFQCIGIGGISVMGAILFDINPILTFFLCFVPRLADGILLGYLFEGIRKRISFSTAACLTGFCSAFFNTVFFMGALLLLFGRTEYVQSLIGGRNLLVFVCAFVGVNALCEMAVSTVLTGAVGLALFKAHFIPAPRKAHA